MNVTRFAESSFFLPAALLTALVVALLLVVGIVALLSRASKVPKGLRVQRTIFFSPTERALLGALDRALGSNYRIFGKVRVAEVLEPHPGLFGRRARRLLRGQVDYVVCRASDLSVLCAINLESEHPSGIHKQAGEKRRARLEAAFHDADLPLLWLPERQSYALRTVHALLAPIITPDEARPPVDKQRAGPRTLETQLN